VRCGNRAIHSLVLLTAPEFLFWEDFASLLARCRERSKTSFWKGRLKANIYPSSMLSRRGATPESVRRMSSVCLFLILVSARFSLHCAGFPLALLFATINLRYAGPPLVLRIFNPYCVGCQQVPLLVVTGLRCDDLPIEQLDAQSWTASPAAQLALANRPKSCY
jgi:hypothetical protein